MERPKLTLQQAEQQLPGDIKIKLSQFYSSHPTGSVIVVAFRGYYLDTMGKPGVNDRGIYDDCMVVVSKEYYCTYNANTDPSGYRDAQGNKPGIATLIPGFHLYKKGKHGITTHADGGYNAFRPATPDESLPVWRDGEGSKIFRGVAINLHRGGYNSTSSEGCQTVYPEQWNEFQTSVYDLMTQYKQDILPYVLIEWVQ